MARVNITIPDDVLEASRAARLNVSRLATGALSDELDRRAKIDALDGYLRDLAAELGPVSRPEQVEAQQWVDRVIVESGTQLPGGTTRTA